MNKYTIIIILSLSFGIFLYSGCGDDEKTSEESNKGTDSKVTDTGQNEGDVSKDDGEDSDSAEIDGNGEATGDTGNDGETSDAGEKDDGEVDSGETDSGAGDDGGSETTCEIPYTEEAGVIAVESGVVRGVLNNNVWLFKGVPYAKAPVGDLRWRPPETADCFDGIRDAKEFGNICPQLNDNSEMVGNEDCLSLNIWTPESAPGSPAKLPVMAFIHGGGNVQGSSSQYLYNGEDLALNGNVVLVTINYRLGVFGYLAHPALSSESEQKVSGNYGILDQIAALKWVKRNIRAFGGDPDRITIFGESAGGVNVCIHLASPLSKGLFNSAIIESGGCTASTLSDEEQVGETVVEKTSCASAEDVAGCLRGLPLEEIFNAVPPEVSLLKAATFQPNVDGYVLEAIPLNVIKNGKHNKVPLIVGSNKDETAKSIPEITSEAGYKAAIYQSFGQTIGDKILAEYPISDYENPRWAMIAVTSDARFICPSRKYARYAAEAQDEPVYRYFFTYSPPSSANGAAHGLELPFVFSTLDDIPLYQESAEETELAKQMGGYWTRFATAGDPNGDESVVWPEYAPETDPHIIFDVPITTGEGVRTEQCDFWDSIVQY